jgi:putative oxidoreductase
MGNRSRETFVGNPKVMQLNEGGVMASIAFWVRLANDVRARLTKAQWVPELLMRVFLGYFFLESGWGKIHSLDVFTQRFTEWGIPFPAFNAALSAYTEFLGGLLTVIGLGTRLVAIPMAFNMLVAIVSVKLKDLQGFNAFFELDEPLYGLGFFWLLFSGPGWVSVDYWISKTVFRRLFGSADDESAQIPIRPALRSQP